MAIRYVSPFTATNGTGTFASPYSIYSTSQPTTSGDEVRIIGKYLTDILEAAEDTYTLTNAYTLTRTAGSIAWASMDVAYLPDYQVFFRVYSVTSGGVTIGTGASAVPIIPELNGTTGIRVKRVTGVEVTTTSATLYIGPQTATVNNITITDGWVADGTRITDGSAVSLAANTATGSSQTVAIGGSSSSSTPTGWTVNLANTHVVKNRIASTSFTQNWTIAPLDSTFTLGVVNLFQTNTTANGRLGQVNEIFGTRTIDVRVLLSSYYTAFGGARASTVVTVDKWACTQFPLYRTTSSAVQYDNADLDLSVNAFYVVTFPSYQLVSINMARDVQLSLGSIYFAAAGTTLAGLYEVTAKTFAVEWKAGFEMRSSATASGSTAVTTATYAIRSESPSSGYVFTNAYGGKTRFQVGSTPPGITLTNNTARFYYANWRSYHQHVSVDDAPGTVLIELPVELDAPTLASSPLYVVGNVTIKTPTTVREMLSPEGTAVSSSGAAYSAYPIVTQDSSVFRTSAPSLKCTLTTLSTTVFASANSYAVKGIKIPVTGGQTYTVSGYVRYTGLTGYTTGLSRVRLWESGTLHGAFDIPTTANGAWQPFSFTFTANETGEANLALLLKFPAAGSYWLDDLQIS